jgi:hypothetical protein
MTIPPPTAIPAMAPLPSGVLLEELEVGLLVDDGEGVEPPGEEDATVGVTVACPEEDGLVAILPIAVLAPLEEVAEATPI